MLTPCLKMYQSLKAVFFLSFLIRMIMFMIRREKNTLIGREMKTWNWCESGMGWIGLLHLKALNYRWCSSPSHENPNFQVEKKLKSLFRNNPRQMMPMANMVKSILFIPDFCLTSGSTQIITCLHQILTCVSFHLKIGHLFFFSPAFRQLAMTEQGQNKIWTINRKILFCQKQIRIQWNKAVLEHFTLYEMLFKDAASIFPCLYCTLHTKKPTWVLLYLSSPFF